MPPTPQASPEEHALSGAPAPDAAPPPHGTPRDDCPWCGSRWLRTRLRRRGPVPSRVDACRECGHAFRNPAPAAATPDADRRRPGPEPAERLPGAPGGRGRALAAARVMLRHAEPESWLDVGTGYGHFPAVAKEVHPYTAFDGLDATRRVERARAAGRIEEAHLGALTDPGVAARLRGRYDVVSMIHHLERTADPRAELRAALTALRPGGHLIVEAPDPDCAYGTLLGRWWVTYRRPRHLHLLPLDNLVCELDSLGCEVVDEDRAAPHVPYDLTGAVTLAFGRSLPAVPLLAAALAADHALAPLVRGTCFSNAYRIVARGPDR
ncbi:class I SAM-dependent methyltransferase [Streptomyces sp. NPDC008313]|uniref:class I SAM-dependent methyltransferase n=1 Tax=Streptomyces sp. NPDC008313 TaxID=3364826 RepID=UPI0036E45DC9